MTNDQQTEIPVDVVPVKKTADNVTKIPNPPKDDEDQYQFTVLASLPYRTFDPMCCSKFSAEVWQTLDDDVFVTYRHASDCEVWRFV